MVKIEEIPENELSPMEVLLGKQLISDPKGTKILDTKKTLASKDFVLLYVSFGTHNSRDHA